jgi:DNA polymerase III alpha subunit
MAMLGIQADPDEATQSAAWRLLDAGDTLGISQVESVGFRMLLRRAHELAELQSPHGHSLRNIEDLAQLLALWKPGVYSKEREEAYFDARRSMPLPSTSADLRAVLRAGAAPPGSNGNDAAEHRRMYSVHRVRSRTPWA